MNTYDFTYHLDDIDNIAGKVLDHLKSKVLLLNGSMGAGKTTFVSALLKAMQSDDVATSPTFSIVNEYSIPQDKMYHFDFYRIESIEEAYNFGVEEYLNSNHWIVIEWAERVTELIPQDAQTLSIKEIGENKRSLKLTIDNKTLTKYIAMTEPKL